MPFALTSDTWISVSLGTTPFSTALARLKRAGDFSNSNLTKRVIWSTWWIALTVCCSSADDRIAAEAAASLYALSFSTDRRAMITAHSSASASIPSSGMANSARRRDLRGARSGRFGGVWLDRAELIEEGGVLLACAIRLDGRLWFGLSRRLFVRGTRNHGQTSETTD